MLSLVSYASSDSDDESDHETMETMPDPKIIGGEGKVPASGSNIASSIRGAKEPSKSVKIFVPSLSEFADDDSGPSAKKSKVSQGSGLFSMLPPPKYTLPSTKIVNRTLIPHSVAKHRPASTTSVTISKAPPVAVPSFRKDDVLSSSVELLDNYADETDSADFFNLDNMEKETLPPPSPIGSHSAVAAADSSDGDPESTTRSITESTVSTSVSQLVDDGDNAPENAPLQFDAAWVSSSSLGGDHTVDIHVSSTNGLAHNEHTHYSAEHSDSDSSSSTSVLDQEALFNDEGFLRLVGKNRHKREDIQFVDVAQSDQIPRYEEWMTKALTEEVGNRPSHKKGFMPTSQQRRKHQITYLAYQAREREVELKNQWAENRLSRRQTQSKYGF